MDPATVVGLAASIAQIIDGATYVVKFVNDVRGSSKDRARLVDEASSLVHLLYQLKDRLREADEKQDAFSAGMRSLGTVHGPLDQITKAAETLTAELQPSTRRNVLRAAISWGANKKKACAEVLASVERTKALIGLVLQQDLMYVLHR